MIGIVETSVLIDLLRGYPPAVNWIAPQRTNTFGINPPIQMELIAGAQNRSDQRRIIQLLSQFEMVRLTADDQDWAMVQQLKFSLSYGVGLTDCLIASVSQRLGVPLYTHNLKHFAPLLGALAQKPY